MPKHYLKILDWLLPYAQQHSVALSDDWQREIFDDLTACGTALRVVPLGENERGLLLGLCGSVFFAEAGYDNERSDSLFVSRLESAEIRLPKVQPKVYRADFDYLTQRVRDRAVADPAAPIFEAVGAQREAGPDDVPSAPTAVHASLPTTPSAPLLRILSAMPDVVRRRWRPGMGHGGDPEPAELLDRLRRVWSKFRLDRFPATQLRVAGLLKGQIRPRKMTAATLDPVLCYFDIGLLNVFVRDPSHSSQTSRQLLTDIADFPLPAAARAVVYAAMLVGMDADGLRRELHESAEALESLSPDQARDWDAPLRAAIREVADRTGDDRLARLAEVAGTPGIATWAKTLRYESPTVAERVVEDEVESPPGGGAAALGGGGGGRLGHEEDAPRHLASGVFPTVTARSEVADASVVMQQALEAARDALAEDVEDASSRESALNRWVLGLRIEKADLDALASDVKNWIDQIASRAGGMNSVTQVAAIARGLVELRAEADEWILKLPDPDLLDLDLQEALEAYRETQEVLGPLVDELVARGITPSDLREIADVARSDDILAQLPDWVWLEDDSSASSGEDVAQAPRAPASRALRLVGPVVRGRVRRLCAMLADVRPDVVAQLSELPMPPVGVDEEIHLETTLKQLRDTQRALTSIAEPHRNWAGQAVQAGATPAEVLRVVGSLEGLKPLMSGAVYAEIIARVTAPQSVAERLELTSDFERAASFFERELGSAEAAGIELLDRWIARHPRPSGAREISTDPASPLEIEHNFVDQHRRRVPLAFVPYEDSDRPYGYVLAPILLRTQVPREVAARIVVNVTTKQREAWPSTWEETSPQDVVVSRLQWRSDESGGFHYTVKLRVPIRRPEPGALEISVVALDKDGAAPLSEQRKLRWESIAVTREPVVFHWPDGINPDYVAAHPIGPQHEYPRIADRLRGGGSVAVIAPRRFGKSTLVEYLRRLSGADGLYVSAPALCTRHHDGVNLNYGDLWLEVSEKLQDELGSSIDCKLEDSLPRGDAFDHVRRAASARGIQSIVLLFDEAQLFFPRLRGYALGDRLKDRLERDWGQAREGMANVLVGLVGLPSLRERGGANLMGLLMPIERSVMEESDLNKLVLGLTHNGLSTTREARVRLAATAGNLFLLRTLLQRLLRHVGADGRNWAEYDDVLVIESALKKSLKEGGEQEVASYLRDALNEAENVSEWRPRPCYAYAAALARALSQGYRDVASRREFVRTQLERWCRAVETDGGNRLVYTDERIEEHEATLRELGLLNESNFRSEIHASWLEGVSAALPRDEADRTAIFRGAMERIRIPEGLEPVTEGGQARVFRFTRHGVEYALRRVTLATAADRKGFLEAVDALAKLKERIDLREDGAEYVFDLRHVGLADDNDMDGIEIYRWIDGTGLDCESGRLPAAVVAFLAVKLATALRLLHRHGIIHRDIAPRNVLLTDDRSRPVLIDFGLARLGTATLQTALNSPFAAPEVRRPEPEWSAAADVYGLGALIGALVAPSDELRGKLKAVEAHCMRTDPVDRPSADELVRELTQIAEDLQIPERQNRAWQRVSTLAEDDVRAHDWFGRVLERFKPRISALTLGLHTSQYDRCVSVAQFVDQVLEASPQRSPRQPKLKLGFVKRANDATQSRLVSDEIDLLHQLRLQAAHYIDRGDRRIRNQFGDLSEEKMTTMVVAGARQVGEYLSLETMPSLVAHILDRGSR
jgi:hypothetical protein